jgi:hypothetical protein
MPDNKADESQIDKFRQLARELEADERLLLWLLRIKRSVETARQELPTPAGNACRPLSVGGRRKESDIKAIG